MGLFSRKEKRAAEPETTPEVSADLLRALFDNDKLTAEMALEIPAFSAAVDFVANTVAMLPVKLYSEDLQSRKTEEVTEDRRLFLLNDEANSLMGAKECRAAQIRDMLLFGSGFVYINQGGYGEISSLNYVKKSDISITSNAHPIFRDYNIYVGGRGYYPFNFVILARNSPDGVTGTGAVDEHKTLLSAMYSIMKYEQAISKTGGSKKGFLQSERALTKAAMDELKRLWHDLYANNENNMMILNNGITYSAAASSAVEMQMNENKRTNSEQIAQIFGLSPEVIAGKCSTEDYMSAVRTAILPIVEKYQEAINRSLLTEEEKGRMYFTLDTSELLKGDTLARYQAYEIALRNNFLQLDEVRYAEDKEPLGFEYMRLGLNDVLYDSKTKTVYTPNMNALANLDGSRLTNDEIRCIMELRKKMNWVKDSKGRFAGSVPMGGGSGGNSGLTNGAESGIIREESQNPITPISDNAIERVQKVSISGYSDEQCDFIQQQHKELLKFSRENNNCNETAFVFQKGLTGKSAFLGSDDKLDFGDSLTNKGTDLFVMHNHPRNGSYSTTDLVFFANNSNVKTLTIVKNNGSSVEYITKSKDFNSDLFKLEYNRLYRRIVENNTNAEKDRFVEKLLSKTKAGVIWSERK